MLRRCRFALPFLLALVPIAACGDDDGGDDDDDDQTCLPGCSYDAQAYELRARFDWEARRLLASEDVTVALAPATTAIILDADVEVRRVYARDTELTFERAPGTLTVELEPILAARTGDEGADIVTFTIDYEAQVATSLIAPQPRDDDPVDARVVFTNSEPDLGSYWLIGKHDPSDRARWAVELTVAAGEDAIANGARVADDDTADGRVIRYQLDTPIPTYLMAFAAGELAHEDRDDGPVPLSIWHRAGLLVDAEAHLDIVADAMTSFTELLGPYPWDSYAVVLVPELGGGMENATITFNAESSGQGNISFGLNAHELAHQWFGDWVTMRTYDDVWVKEGMATLLASEATRARRDTDGTGRLFGIDFAFGAGDAIVDRSLTGLEKYTSGPYQRAAWTITQIRARVGEDAFWASLREVLAAHAHGSVDGETFLRHFAPALDDAAIAQLLGALEITEVPFIDFTVASTGAGTDVTIELSDPDAIFLEPIAITVIDADGDATSHELVANTPLTVTVPEGGYLAPDEGDVHPSLDAFEVSENYAEVAALYLPTGTAALAAFADRTPVHQERVLFSGSLPVGDAPAFAALYPELDSTLARRAATVDACYVVLALAGEPDLTAPWLDALTPILAEPPISTFDTSYGYCGAALPTAVFADELAALGADIDAEVAARVEYLLSFDYGDASLALVGAVATGAPSLRLRDVAITRLGFQTLDYPYSAVSAEPDRLAAWRQFFRDRLTDITSASRFRAVWRGINGLADVAALPLVAPLFHTLPLSASTIEQTLCDAYLLTIELPEAWTAFLAALAPVDELSAAANAILSAPALACM